MPTPTPSPLPVLTPSPGEPLPLSLGWRFDANGHLTAGIAAAPGGQPAFLLTSLGRTVYALRGDGQVAWRVGLAGPAYTLALLDEGKIAVGDDAGFVTLLDGTGRRLWRYDTGSRVTAVAAWQAGLLTGGWDRCLTVLTSDGEVLWQADLGGPVSGVAILSDPGGSGGAGLAVAATLDGEIHAFDPTGIQVWRVDVGAPVTALAAVKGGGVLAGAQDGRLLALDAAGEVRWQRPVGEGAPLWHAADVAGNAAPEIVAGSGGAAPRLTLLTADGEVLWHIALPSPVGAIVSADLDGDGPPEVLVGLMNGQVWACDGQGRLRGSVQAGLAVWGLAPADDGSVLILADVSAWQLRGSQGPKGSPWLSPPKLSAWPEVLPPGTEAAPAEAILAFLGDVAPGRTMEQQLARYGPAYPWAGLGLLLAGADLTVANLECTLTTRGRPLNKPYLLRAHPRWSRTLAAAGIDLVTLANNHALDYGQAGLDETLEVVEGLGIAAVGAGRSSEQAHRPALFRLNGVRVAVLGYAAARWNGSADVPATEQIAWAEPAAVQADVRAIRHQADVVVVLLHAGVEYAPEPSADQVAVAHAAVDAGADLVVGHHPHVVQTVERYRGGLIVYSLGDALFDIPRPAAMLGHLLRLHVTPAGLVRAELWPFWIEDAIRPRLLDDGQGTPRYQVIYP